MYLSEGAFVVRLRYPHVTGYCWQGEASCENFWLCDGLNNYIVRQLLFES